MCCHFCHWAVVRNNLLSGNGINYTILFTVYKADNTSAIQFIQMNNVINDTERSNMIDSNLFCTTNVTGYKTHNISQLNQISQQFMASVKFSIPRGQVKDGVRYNLIGNYTPTFSLGIWSQNTFIHPASNSSFVLVGAIDTSFENYSAPNLWDRLFGYALLTNNTVYILTMTFLNRYMKLYLNSTLIEAYTLDYPLSPLNPPLIYMDYNINATIIDAGIWSIAFNAEEIGYMDYNSLEYNN
jgi:hypothetical protein